MKVINLGTTMCWEGGHSADEIEWRVHFPYAEFIDDNTIIRREAYVKDIALIEAVFPWITTVVTNTKMYGEVSVDGVFVGNVAFLTRGLHPVPYATSFRVEYEDDDEPDEE